MCLGLGFRLEKICLGAWLSFGLLKKMLYLILKIKEVLSSIYIAHQRKVEAKFYFPQT